MFQISEIIISNSLNGSPSIHQLEQSLGEYIRVLNLITIASFDKGLYFIKGVLTFIILKYSVYNTKVYLK